MQKQGDRLLFSPKDLIQFLQSDFATWMERAFLEQPEQFPAPAEPDEMMTVLTQLGNEHEQRYLNKLLSNGEQIYQVETRGGFEATAAAMVEGKPWIYQAALRYGDWVGYADLMRRVEVPSQLGDWSYIPVECKLALNPKPYFVIQLCAYCDLLAQVQGLGPGSFELVLGSGERTAFRTEDYFHYYRQVQRSFLSSMKEFDHQQQPLPMAGDHGDWQTVAEKILDQADHLSQVANISVKQIQRLEAAGISTVQQLAEAQPGLKVPKLNRDTFERLRLQAKLQRDSEEKGKPLYELLPKPEGKDRYGLTLLPPASELDVFFDMEGYPLAEGGAGLEYLFGATYEATGELQFKDWWAHNPAQEKQAFEDFIDWTYDRWLADPTMHIYHYAPYETTALKRLMGRYGTREEQVDNLLRGNVFVDLYQVVRQGLCVGEPSYSIKNLEHLYWPDKPREGDVVNAQASVVQYFQWMQSDEGESIEDSKILKDIYDYNKDDCDSTKALADWLRDIQTEAGITYCATESVKTIEEQQAVEQTPAGQLAMELLEEATPQPWTEKLALEPGGKRLLGHLLDFHRREAKPSWWKRFSWLTSDEADLVDELDCLAGLQRTDAMPEQVKKSWAFEYRFEPGQETKLKENTACWMTQSEVMKDCSLLDVDATEGIARIKISDKKLKTIREEEPNWEPPSRTSLMDMTQIRTGQISNAILETVQRWKDSSELQPALADFLERRNPRLLGHTDGLLIAPDEELLAGTLRVISNLDNSCLCIQGPPGSGKTFTAAKVILNLLQQGKTVAVSANSHAVIFNLLARVQGYSEETDGRFGIIQIPSSTEKAKAKAGVAFKKKIAEALPPEFQLVGATVFQLCRAEAVDQFDYLFIDEAGQVSLANLVALARCARNLVLIGDPMQLEQPIQGNHPGASGESALGYLLDGKATVPEDLGIFLGVTYRMEPAIARYVSEGIYESRLTHHPDTSYNRLESDYLSGPSGTEQGWEVIRSSGIAVVPVLHQGNGQASDEEVDVINELVEQLLGVGYVSDRGEVEGEITLNDILLVTPYNLQVGKLRDRLGKEARIGTVDKFQGQEAPVVIVSMCASTTEDAPRGIEFLLNRNRLNVAVSRAQCLAIVVASPALAMANCSTLEQMTQVNLFCKLMN